MTTIAISMVVLMTPVFEFVPPPEDDVVFDLVWLDVLFRPLTSIWALAKFVTSRKWVCPFAVTFTVPVSFVVFVGMVTEQVNVCELEPLYESVAGSQEEVQPTFVVLVSATDMLESLFWLTTTVPFSLMIKELFEVKFAVVVGGVRVTLIPGRSGPLEEARGWRKTTNNITMQAGMVTRMFAIRTY